MPAGSLTPDVLERMLDAAPDAVLAVRDDGRIVYVNSQVGALFGYERDELVGSPVERLVPGRFRAAHSGHRDGYFENPVTRPMGLDLDLYARRKDGSEFPAEISLSTIETKEGPLATAAIRDLTARRQAEAKFEHLLEAAPDAVVIVDTGGSITLVNAQTERLFGYHRAELLGQPVEMLIPERVREGHVGHRAGFVTRPGVRPMGASLDLFGLHKQGHEFPVEISLSPLESENGLLVSAAIRDISERREAERALADARAELKRRELARRQAVDINDNIIQGLAVALYDARRNHAEAAESAIEATLDQARRIVSELQAEGEIEAGELRREGSVPKFHRGGD